jgi:hypothetical protein
MINLCQTLFAANMAEISFAYYGDEVLAMLLLSNIRSLVTGMMTARIKLVCRSHDYAEKFFKSFVANRCEIEETSMLRVAPIYETLEKTIRSRSGN